ncbi:MAG: ABC transporter permease, partial [Advenella sp.]
MMRVWLLRILIVGGFLLAWQLGSGSVIPEFFVSKPSIIIAKFWLWVVNGSLFFHAGITVVEALAGFLLGGLAGLSIGMLLGRNELLGKVFDPIIVVFYSIPKVALAPLFVIWLGIGIEMKIVLTGTIVFFLVFLSTYTGVRNVSRELVAIMKLMGATERQVVFKL